MERRLNDPEWSPTSPADPDHVATLANEAADAPKAKEEKDSIIKQLQTEVEQQVGTLLCFSIHVKH